MARFNFRHGIARRQQDSNNNPNNLQPSNGGSYVDLIVSPDPTAFLIAHFDVDYLVTENATVAKAWGPFTSGTDYWLYWDVDFQTGALSRGYTTLEPEFGAVPPSSPAPDQHWFDTSAVVQKVWTGSSWIEKLRVFAAKYQSGTTLIYYPLGTQVGISGGAVFAGKILFDPDLNPLQKFQRNRRGQFITTETDLNSQFNRISNFRVEAAVVQGEAQENIPIHHAVSLNNYDTLVLADHDNSNRPAIGVATEDMFTGEVRSYITKGFLTDEVNWDWSAYPAQTGIFLGAAGELVAEPDPLVYHQQLLGYIVNRNTVFINIEQAIALEPPAQQNELAVVTDRNTGKKVGRRIPRFLEDLQNVDIANPQDGDVIIWDSNTNTWVLQSNCCGGGSGSPQSLNDLSDVTAVPAVDGYVLVYRSGSPGGWVAEPSTTTDEFVRASSTDTTTGHLNSKLVAGTGISLNLLNSGGNEQFEIALSGGVPGAASAGLFVTGVSSPGGGIVSDFAYVPGTVPSNTVLLEATSDQETVRIEFIVEGDQSFYSPTVIVDVPTGTPAIGDNVIATLTQDPQDIRTFHGYADINIADGLTAGRMVYLEASHGATASVLIKRAPEAPQIQTMTFSSVYPTVAADPTSGYPGGTQTTIKSGDVFYVSGSVDNSATLVALNTGGAVGGGTYTTATAGGNLGAIDSAGAGYRTFLIRFNASSASGVQTATAEAQNSFGSWGNPFVTTNNVVMDQISPSVSIGSVNYPTLQSALKLSESATVTNTVSGQDYVYYYENGGAGFIDISNPITYEASKTVTRIGGNYVYNGNNFAIKAYKTSNGTTTTVATGDVNISNVAPSVAISGATMRLVSSPSGENYAITLTFTQRLRQAPTIASSGDTTAGDRGSWSGSGDTWSFTLTVDDADVKGTYTWVVNNVNTLSNNTYNNIIITSGVSYEIGGFTTRLVTVGALEQVVDLNVDITDPSKVTVKYAGTTDNLTYRASDLSQFQKGWSTVDDTQLVYTPGAEPFPNWSNFVFQDATVTPSSWLFLTDAAFAGSNTTGTLQLEIGEAA